MKLIFKIRNIQFDFWEFTERLLDKEDRHLGFMFYQFASNPKIFNVGFYFWFFQIVLRIRFPNKKGM